MSNNKKNSRKHSRKALNAINEIREEYPEGIPDVTAIDKYKRAWLQSKIQQMRECLKNVRFPSKPNWWELLRLSRNKTAHQTEDFSDKAFSELCGEFFAHTQEIAKDLQSNIKRYQQKNKKKRTFEKFAPPAFGTESERAQLVDALEDAINPVEPKEQKINFPKNTYSELASDVLSEILNHENAQEYAHSHEGFSENIQTDILEWLKKTNDQLKKENLFAEEAAFIEQQKKRTAQEIAMDISAEKSKIRYHYKRLPSVSEAQRGSIAESSMDFDFYKNQFSTQKKIIKKTDIEEEIGWQSEETLEALCRNFIADMENNLLDRKNKWEQERIDAARKQFLEGLYKKIAQFQRLEKLVSPFINNLGYLWDLSSRPFETSGFEILDSFAILLEKDESLQELAALLGKQSRAQSVFKKELRDKVVITHEFHPKPAYRGQVMGVKYSNDIASILPSELALFKNEKTKKLFMLKFAQKQLLSYKYETDEAVERQETEQEELSIEKKEPKGPIIICVDTSGSMHGTPENIAKTVTFALAKIAIEEERKCYLISFSTEIEMLDMRDFKTGNALEKLVHFLRMSFHGGTDATPALNHALKLLKENDWKNADVLMISDFVMGNLSDDMMKAIDSEKEKETEFHSLVIGASGNNAAIQCFNHNWQYDTNDPHAARHLAEQLHELKM